MNPQRAEHVTQAQTLLAEAANIPDLDRGDPRDLSFLLEANVHAMLAVVDALNDLTEQASPAKPHSVYGRALEAVTQR